MTGDLVVGLKIARDDPALHLLGGTIAEAKHEKNGVVV